MKENEEVVCIKKIHKGVPYCEQKCESLFEFTGSTISRSGYFIVNLNREAEFIGEYIIDDLKESDGIYCIEDILAYVDNVSDSLKGALIAKVRKYLDENW